MSEEARQRIEQFESLFQHPGWKLFIEDVKGWKDAVDGQWRHLTDARGLHLTQGRIAGLEQVTGFEGLIESLKQEALDE